VGKKKFVRAPPPGRGGGGGGGGGGRGQICFYLNFYYFFLGAHEKIWNPTTTPSMRISKKNLKKPKNRPPGGQGVGIRILFFFQNFYYFF
jgi:hypothetical protein